MSKESKSLWALIEREIEAYFNEVDTLPVFPKVDSNRLFKDLESFHFQEKRDPEEAIQFVVRHLRESHLQTAHPAYFGVFNPAADPMGIAGEWLVAAFNPQLASWTSSPFAIAVEQHLLGYWSRKFGLPENSCGTFTSGGTEANHTALLTALTRHFPSFGKKGLHGLAGIPVLYGSKETHHSILKSARLCGLGTEAVREISTDSNQKMKVAELEKRIRQDRKEGFIPFLIVGTAGSTSQGAIDPLDSLADVAERENLWLHVDAAWGGAAVLVPELLPHFKGIERADSITLDAHKWLNVPMTAGMFMCRHPSILRETFSVDFSPYMPADSHGSSLPQPFQESMGWSRRFRGLELFLAFAVTGEEGYCKTLRNQVKMGVRLREMLSEAGWKVLGTTPLPVVCFEGELPSEEIAKRVADSGRSWITTTHFEGRTVLRAGIANYRTTEKDLKTLVDTLSAVSRI